MTRVLWGVSKSEAKAGLVSTLDLAVNSSCSFVVEAVLRGLVKRWQRVSQAPHHEPSAQHTR